MKIYSSLEVRDGAAATAPSLAEALDWLGGYLTAPHPDLGRGGAVCPYVKPAVKTGSLYLAEARLHRATSQAVDRCLSTCRHAFAELPAGHGTALVITFPGIAAGDAPWLLGGLLQRVKPEFVRDGLMLGPVYPGNKIPGAHNPAFRPMSGPFPLVAIRRMMETDLPFLSRPTDPPHVRAEYVVAFLHHVAPRLSPSRRAAAERTLAQLQGAHQ
jgi:hypothetical protein